MKTRSVEVKKIDTQKVAVLLRKLNLWFDERKVENFPEKEIQKQVFLDTILHAKGNPVVVINPYTDESFWNWKKNYINIGVLTTLSTKAEGYDTKQIAKTLFYHELSHENNTTVPKDVPYPFALLNIFEDERIERLATERFNVTDKDFAELHQFSFDVYYYDYEGGRLDVMTPKFFNPYNLIILYRWMRWSNNVKELYEKVLYEAKKLNCVPEQVEKVLPEYTQDIEKVLDDATNSKSTEELIQNTLWFYEKWKHLFTPEAELHIQMGAGHGSEGDVGEGYGQNEESGEGKGNDDRNTDGQCDSSGGKQDNDEGQGIGKNSENMEGSETGKENESGKSGGKEFDPERKLPKEALEWIEKTLEEAELNNDPESEVEKNWDIYEIEGDYIEDSYRFSDTPIWNLKHELIKNLENIIKQIRWQKKNTKSERTMLGKRVDARRIENLLPNPMKHTKEVVDVNTPKTLFVIDGSGSMNGNPYYNAIHLATAFSNVLKKNVQIVVTTPEKAVKVTAEDLLYFKCDGGVENLISVKSFIENNDYDLIIFFTDANVIPEDMEFLYQLKNGKWKDKVIGMVTTLHDVERAREWLSECFYKSIVARDIESLTKELAFRIKRGR